MSHIVIAKPGEVAEIVAVAGPEEASEKMRAAIGGWLEACPYPPEVAGTKLAAWCHEEGLLEGLPWNRWTGPGTPIAGPIVVTGISEEGETIALPFPIASLVALHLNRLPQMPPTPSSLDEYEEMVGHPAVQVFMVGENGEAEKVKP